MSTRDTADDNIAGEVMPWHNGGWQAAISVFGRGLFLVGPCTTTPDGPCRMLGKMLSAIMDGTIKIEPIDDDGEAYVVLTPGGCVHPYLRGEGRMGKVKALAKRLEKYFAGARARQQKLQVESAASLAKLQAEIREKNKAI